MNEEITHWFEIPLLTREPFLAINLSNRKASSRSTNKVLFGTNQTGHWNIPHAALNVGLERKTVLLFYTNPNQGTELYVGKVASKVVTSKTQHRPPRDRYTVTVMKCWKKVGQTGVTFSEFFTGFRMSSNPTVVWIDGRDYMPPPGQDGIDSSSVPLQLAPGGFNYMAMVAQRANHDIFARDVRAAWNGACAVTGLSAPRLLQAAHLIPWNVANRREKTNLYNGLLLCVHLHALLDSHLLAFADDGALLLAKDLPPGVKKLVLSSGKTCLRRPTKPEQIPFLRRHREAAQEMHNLMPVKCK
ncbi:HNH endonuclease [Undibacterium arcticum]|uniref:HNH endonuclease n=1 Tax=Undibacterium arcticum TaxID=1762892 RepID=A0ABV7F5X9_9BURK